MAWLFAVAPRGGAGLKHPKFVIARHPAAPSTDGLRSLLAQIDGAMVTPAARIFSQNVIPALMFAVGAAVCAPATTFAIDPGVGIGRPGPGVVGPAPVARAAATPAQSLCCRPAVFGRLSTGCASIAAAQWSIVRS